MHCTNCGTALSSGTSFCANCGTPVAQTAAPVAQPVYNNQYSAPPANSPDGTAVAALIVSLSTLVFTAGTLSFVGAIIGHVALGNIKKNGKGGRGMAVAAIAIGWTLIGLWILAGILIFAIAAAGYNSYSY